MSACPLAIGLVNVKKMFLVVLATWPWVALAPRAFPG